VSRDYAIFARCRVPRSSTSIARSSSSRSSWLVSQGLAARKRITSPFWDLRSPRAETPTRNQGLDDIDGRGPIYPQYLVTVPAPAKRLIHFSYSDLVKASRRSRQSRMNTCLRALASIGPRLHCRKNLPTTRLLLPSVWPWSLYFSYSPDFTKAGCCRSLSS
jgi:hypothetical protein